MDFQEIWGKPSEIQPASPDRAQLAEMLGKESHGLLAKLRQQLRAKMYMGIGSLGMMVALGFVAKDSNIMMLIVGLMLAMGAVLMAGVYRNYRRLPDHVDMGQEMLPLLRTYDRIVRKALRFEERVGAIFIIPAPALGALLGLSVESGKSLGELLSKPGIIILLLVLMAIVGPLGIWLTIWMNRVAFGKYLDKLKRNIEDLENL